MQPWLRFPRSSPLNIFLRNGEEVCCRLLQILPQLAKLALFVVLAFPVHQNHPQSFRGVLDLVVLGHEAYTRLGNDEPHQSRVYLFLRRARQVRRPDLLCGSDVCPVRVSA
jgi:hypothetical protein